MDAPRDATSQYSIVSVGVDWVTATAPSDGRDHRLISYAASLVECFSREGYDLRTWRWNQYDGRSAGPVSYGLRKDGAICRLSGVAAHEHWWALVGVAANVSRLDVEVTIKADPPDDTIAAEAFFGAAAWSQGRNDGTKVKRVETKTRTETCYIGSRSSQTYGRLYDKDAESDAAEWRACWRYEVECKEETAARLARILRHHADPRRAILVYVWDWFARRGVKPAFARASGDVHVQREAATTDDERRLKWLGDQVQPVLSVLIANGLGGRALWALGVTPEVVERHALQKGK